MSKQPATPHQLRARWLHEDERTDFRHEAVAAVRAIQLGERDWESYLTELPFVDEVPGGRDLRGLDLSAMRGIPGLKYARDGFLDLSHANLYRANMAYANLYRVHLEEANLYSVVLDDANLTNVHLRGAVIEYVSVDGAKISKTDLRGFNLNTVKNLHSAELSEVRLGDTVLSREQFRQPDGRYALKNEVQADEYCRECHYRPEKVAGAVPLYEAARGTYLALKNNFASIGEHAQASWAAYKEKDMERRLLGLRLRLGSFRGILALQKRLEYFGYSFFDKLFKYGENPWRLVWWAMVVIIVSALLYPLSGIALGTGAADPSGVLTYWNFGSSAELVQGVLISLYFSAVSFTTLGYGDWAPVGWLARFLGSGEALVGMLFFGLFVWTLGRRVTAR
ncbi:MAG: hypothetical protein B1H03_07020 [Planctomycetales bacterium 4484_113]|nr:MAG: hypothetical protein B1H03_07020 [Planctomycetales bacterium 4484_113]